MKASELRIGNKLMLSKAMQQSLFDSCEISLRNNVITITKIDIDNDIEALVNTIDGDDEIIDFCLDANIKQIPLTEELIFKFSRWVLYNKIGQRKIFCHYVYEAIQWEMSGGVLCVYFREQQIAQLEYLHQLQNLYFALTGEELTLKTETNE